MFIANTNKELQQINLMIRKLEDSHRFFDTENRNLRESIRDLQLRHEQLLKHLGLVEHKVAEHIELKIEIQAPATTQTVEHPINPPEPSPDKKEAVESFSNREEKTSEFKFLRS
jgi:hypothetical protein